MADVDEMRAGIVRAAVARARGEATAEQDFVVIARFGTEEAAREAYRTLAGEDAPALFPSAPTAHVVVRDDELEALRDVARAAGAAIKPDGRVLLAHCEAVAHALDRLRRLTAASTS